MAAKDARANIVLACTDCKQRNYTTKKNKKNTPDRIDLSKFCPFCRKHTDHRETRSATCRKRRRAMARQKRS